MLKKIYGYDNCRITNNIRNKYKDLEFINIKDMERSDKLEMVERALNVNLIKTPILEDDKGNIVLECIDNILNDKFDNKDFIGQNIDILA